ncbi:hypothetical protein ES288_D08G200700v1 [Gossypium darwinii]|uniref:Uncharacterized protein n=1 Tax=Gossypium darwinii TaxID=34276 RepID=A0A5D2BNP3_GOSDA|nr:hypothetical protein ES288_D08G200700v1 [Gossypium darwinii]
MIEKVRRRCVGQILKAKQLRCWMVVSLRHVVPLTVGRLTTARIVDLKVKA